MINGKCHCTYNEDLGPGFRTCHDNFCTLANSNDQCFSMISNHKLIKGCVDQKECWGVDKVNVNKDVINCCGDSLCNAANDGTDMKFIPLGMYNHT